MFILYIFIYTVCVIGTFDATFMSKVLFQFRVGQYLPSQLMGRLFTDLKVVGCFAPQISTTVVCTLKQLYKGH